MADLKLINQAGKDAGEVTLSDNVFGIEPDENVVFDAVIRQGTGMRQGTHATGGRPAVRGGGEKPRKQEGAGRARQDSIKAPQWRGGGTVFGPTSRSYAYSLSREVRRLATKSVLLQELRGNNLIVLDQLNLDAPKMKEFKTVLGNLNVDSRVLVVSDNENVQLSARDLENIKAVPANDLNVADAVNYDKLTLTQDTVKRTEEVLA